MLFIRALPGLVLRELLTHQVDQAGLVSSLILAQLLLRHQHARVGVHHLLAHVPLLLLAALSVSDAVGLQLLLPEHISEVVELLLLLALALRFLHDLLQDAVLLLLLRLLLRSHALRPGLQRLVVGLHAHLLGPCRSRSRLPLSLALLLELTHHLRSSQLLVLAQTVSSLVFCVDAVDDVVHHVPLLLDLLPRVHQLLLPVVYLALQHGPLVVKHRLLRPLLV
mmetsp:Transcript_21268/g.48116  ORF Transcript_21268/g.48116 Transcript_21268/m.48116 type:complete len:223 (+) Transcript_21268:398-1066(+)